jgi:hypothetical protein
MSRSVDIRDKLAYTLVKYQELSDDVRAAQKSEGEVPYVAQKVGDILSGCRECFDYCAKDIADRFIATSCNQKLASRYVAGKEKAYFPFFSDQLKNGKLFFELSTSCPQLYTALVDLAAKIEKNQVIPNTVSSYGIAAEISELVNAKKHDKITSTRIKSNAATRIVFPSGADLTVSPMFPWTGDVPDFAVEIEAQPMVESSGVQVTYVREFKMVDNNWEVTRYCRQAIHATSSILTEIYNKHFGTAIDYFDPWETTKPKNVKKAEAVIKAISPIASHLLVVALLLDEKEAFKAEISVEGVPAVTGLDDVSIANLFVMAFERFIQHRHLLELMRLIHEDPDSVDHNDLSPSYSEITIPLPVRKAVVINGGRVVSFNKILLGIGTKFRCEEKIAAPTIDNESLVALHAIVESPIPKFDLRTDELGRILSCAIVM